MSRATNTDEDRDVQPSERARRKSQLSLTQAKAMFHSSPLEIVLDPIRFKGSSSASQALHLLLLVIPASLLSAPLPPPCRWPSLVLSHSFPHKKDSTAMSRISSSGRRFAAMSLIYTISLVGAAPFPLPSSTSPIASPTSGPTATFSTDATAQAITAPDLTATSTSSDYLLIGWQTAQFPVATAPVTTAPVATATVAAAMNNDEQVAPLLLQPAPSITTVPATPTSWAVAPTFSDMSSFSVSAFAAGASNLAILLGSPAPYNGTKPPPGQELFQAFGDTWDDSINSLQIRYPNGSINPGNSPQGGTEFYAKPLDISLATNASLEYSVYFPHDFEFVKGGKLPGLYGGHKGCSGGNSAVE